MGNNMHLKAIRSTASAIASSTTFTSAAYDITHMAEFSVIVDLVSGTSPDFTIYYSVAASGDSTYIQPDNSYILQDSTTTAVAFSVVPAPLMKVSIQNNSANTLSINADLVLQERW